MKIGILTQPLQTNYGGLLQAYALQEVLRRMGHEAITVDRRNVRPAWQFPLRVGKRVLVDNLLRSKKLPWVPRDFKAVSKHTDRFIQQNICTTELIPNRQAVAKLRDYGFDAFVVGSDQVWRPCYSPGQETYFLDFLDGAASVKKVAYAASFGVADWEFSPELAQRCARLAQQFNAISVREDSGLDLCREYLGVAAQHVLDPTLLLSREDYLELIAQENISKRSPQLMAYVLDKTQAKQGAISQVSEALRLPIFAPMPPKNYLMDRTAKREECSFPSVATWLSGFRDAEYVITDSFHGTVFSIIFQKPFVAIGNAGRGMPRFSSLLKQFGLEERLVIDNLTDIPMLLEKPIDWTQVNTIWRREVAKGKTFLKNTLG